jgi:hypothetical protein
MPLPEGFNEWEHLQYVMRRVHNDAVRDFFRSQADDDIGTTKGAAKHACLMKDDDTTAMTTLRMWLFWVICRKMRDNFEPYYGIPVSAFDSEVKYKPQVTCFFLEDPEDVEPGYRPVEGQLSIRLKNEVNTTITNADLQTYANRINLAFGQGNGYVWKKGKELYSYADKENGYYFKVLARNQSDATEIINKLLDINNDTINTDLLRLNEATNPSSAFPTIPGNQLILNKTYKKPRQRPIADVRFVYASLKIWGLPKPKVLVDKTGYWNEAVIPAW